jgi:hypothetical protein
VLSAGEFCVVLGGAESERTLKVLKSDGERQSYSTAVTMVLHSGHLGCSWSQLTRHRKSKLQWLQGTAIARSEIRSKQIVHASCETYSSSRRPAAEFEVLFEGGLVSASMQLPFTEENGSRKYSSLPNLLHPCELFDFHTGAAIQGLA